MPCRVHSNPGRRRGARLLGVLLLISGAPTSALAVNANAADVLFGAADVHFGAGPHGNSFVTAHPVAVTAPRAGAAVTAIATASPPTRSLRARIKARVVRPVAGVKAGARAAGLRHAVDTTTSPPGVGARSANGPAPAQRRGIPRTLPQSATAPPAQRGAGLAASRSGVAGPVGSRGDAPGERSAFAPPARTGAAAPSSSQGPTRREALPVAARVAARSALVLLALIAAFGVYLLVQRGLDGGPRMAWIGDRRHSSPDDETIYI